MTDLARHIQTIPLMDTHEHLHGEEHYVAHGPDVLADLFDNYVAQDLWSAGAAKEAVQRLVDASDPDIEARWDGVKDIWPRCRMTGYGQAVAWLARTVYGMETITLAGIAAAALINARRREPGERLRILREEGGLDHVQIDNWTWVCAPDASGPDFFLYDLSWLDFSVGRIEREPLHTQTGIEVRDLPSLRAVFARLFEQNAPCAIAVKVQHAYDRTIRWEPRTDAEAAPVLQKLLGGTALDEAEQLCLGDWCLARGVELAIEHNLPVKFHTGYLAGNDNLLHHDRIGPANLSDLIRHYPAARFVLMHIGYPYSGEIIALAKHYPNVWLDLCWAWSISPPATATFLREALQTVPVNKLFVFGGDTMWPSSSVAYAHQARAGLTRALQAAIDDGLLSETEAIALATRLMRENQAAFFDLDGTRAAIHARLERQ